MSQRIQILVLVLGIAGCSGNDANQEQSAGSSPQSTFDRESILGIWWSPDMFQTAAFQINDSTIYYPDAFAQRKYELKGDSLFISLEDGFVMRSAVIKVTADTLILSAFGQEQVFTRAETQKP
jgi:hypothetical protein